jgi:hypothetical protein
MPRNLTPYSKIRIPRSAAILLVVIACAGGSAAALASTLISSDPVSVYPIAGSRVAPPEAQLAFRGVTPHDLTRLVVSGSSTGAHAGKVRAASDGRGVSFLPDKPFQPGELITVKTSLNVRGATHGAAGGLSADLHEFTLTPRGTALITAYYPVWSDASSVHAAKRQVAMDSVVQEIDVKTGLLLFQWDSLDHVPLTDTYTDSPKQAASPLDHFHVNSIEEDRDGNLVISARSTSAAYKVDRKSGKIIWTLGGKRSSFKMGPGTRFSFQHDVRIRSAGDRLITLFDNGGGPPRLSPESRGLTLKLDLAHKTATRVAEQRRPAVSIATAGDKTIVYASWNGATQVSSWRVLSGDRADRLSQIASASKHGFETVIKTDAQRYIAVQALDADGHVLSTSPVVERHGVSGS